MSLVDQNKDVARRYFSALNRRALDELDTLLASDYRSHIPGLPPGRAGYRELLQQFHAAFADLQTRIESLVAEGDRVAVLNLTSGTHTGLFLGHPPSGRSFRATGVDILRISDGVITDRWGVFDTFSMLQQLGLAPAGAPPSARGSRGQDGASEAHGDGR